MSVDHKTRLPVNVVASPTERLRPVVVVIDGRNPPRCPSCGDKLLVSKDTDAVTELLCVNCTRWAPTAAGEALAGLAPLGGR